MRAAHSGAPSRMAGEFPPRPDADVPLAAPVEIRGAGGTTSRLVTRTHDWQSAVRLLSRESSTILNAHGQMTDAMLADLAHAEQLTSLNLHGAKAVTDDGVRQLVQFPRLQHLDLSGTALTDAALAAVGELHQLETISLAWTRVTDVGIANLAKCERLRDVNLIGTRTGDGALRAFAGKHALRDFRSGSLLTDEGLKLLHDLPVFKAWQGGEVQM